MFTPYGILLVGERERSILDACDAILVIQRCFGGLVDSTINGEDNVLVAEGLGSGRAFRIFKVFGWTGELEEGNNDEVDDSSVEGSVDLVLQVESFEEVTDDGDVAGVGSGRRLVGVAAGFDEVLEQGMEVFGVDVSWVARSNDCGVCGNQVGDALAHRQ